MQYLPRSSRIGRRQKSFSFKRLGTILVLAVFLVIIVLCVRYYTLYLALKAPATPTIWRPEGAERAQFLLAGSLDNRVFSCTLLSIGPAEDSPVFILSIPAETLLGDDDASFASVCAQSGIEEAIARLNSALGNALPVTHYVHYDLEGLASIVAVLETVAVDIPEGFQGSSGATDYLFAPGQVSITTANMAPFLTSKDAEADIAFWAEKSLLVAVFNELFTLNNIGFYVRNAGSISDCYQSDLVPRQLAKFRNTLQALAWDEREFATLPGRWIGSGSSQYWEPNPGLIDIRLRQIIGNIPDYDKSQLIIDVFNGNGVSGFAGSAATALKEQGFNVGVVDNAEIFSRTHIYYQEEYLLAAMEISHLLDIDAALIQDRYSGSENPVAIILGQDLIGR